MLLVCFLLLLFGTCLIFYRHVLRRASHPPGPLGLPFVGSLLPKLLRFLHIIPLIPDWRVFPQLRRHYGDVWSLEFYSQRFVVLASFPALQECFVRQADLFAGRPMSRGCPIYSIYSRDRHGIIFSDGDRLRSHRQLVFRAFRELGVGGPLLESSISAASNRLLDSVSREAPATIEPLRHFIGPIASIVFPLMFGSADSSSLSGVQLAKYQDLLHAMEKSEFADVKMVLAPSFFQSNLARRLFADVANYYGGLEGSLEMVQQLCQARARLRDRTDPESPPSCVLDYFLDRARAEKQGSSNEEGVHDVDLVQCMFDLTNGGLDTTNNMLAYCCLMLGRDPELQTILRAEVHAAVSSKLQTNSDSEPRSNSNSLVEQVRNLSMRHKRYCPQLLSFIDEVQRYCVLVTKLQHRVMQPCSYRGYKLLPDDIVFGDLYTVYRDPDLFCNPDQFIADRFLEPDETQTGQYRYVPHPALLSFGLGRRRCVGEKLAVMELFMFLAKLVACVEIQLPPKTVQDFECILEGRDLLVHTPAPHEIILHWEL